MAGSFFVLFSVTEGDKIDLILTSRQHAEACVSVRHSDAVSLLISRFQTNHEFAGDVCDVCREDGDCRDGACVVVNGQGRCAQSCLMHGDCPEGFLCTSVRSLDRTQSNQCLPISGRCVSGCDSKRVQESRSEIDIGIDAELEMNLCSGRIKQVNVDVEPWRGFEY